MENYRKYVYQYSQVILAINGCFFYTDDIRVKSQKGESCIHRMQKFLKEK